jgi:hypothetical protein
MNGFTLSPGLRFGDFQDYLSDGLRLIIRLPLPPLRGGVRAVIVFGIWGFSRLFVGWMRLIIRLPLPPLRGGLRAVIGFGIWGFSRLFFGWVRLIIRLPLPPLRGGVSFGVRLGLGDI